MTEGREHPTRRTGESLEHVRRDLNRAVRRLSVLEYVILFGIVVLALVGGALLALLLEAAFGLPFRTTWVAAAIALFALPGGVMLSRERLERGAARSENESTGRRDEDDG